MKTSPMLIPNSFLVNPSTMTPSLNLYVSQQTTTGTLCIFAIMATIAVPAREYTAPLEKSACAPTKTVVTWGNKEGSAGKRTYVQGIEFAPLVRDRTSTLPGRID